MFCFGKTHTVEHFFYLEICVVTVFGIYYILQIVVLFHQLCIIGVDCKHFFHNLKLFYSFEGLCKNSFHLFIKGIVRIESVRLL